MNIVVIGLLTNWYWFSRSTRLSMLLLFGHDFQTGPATFFVNWLRFWEEKQSTPRFLCCNPFVLLAYFRVQNWLSLISPPTQHIKTMQMLKIMLINARMVRIKNAGHFKYTYSQNYSMQWISMVTPRKTLQKHRRIHTNRSVYFDQIV